MDAKLSWDMAQNGQKPCSICMETNGAMKRLAIYVREQECNCKFCILMVVQELLDLFGHFQGRKDLILMQPCIKFERNLLVSSVKI